MKKKFAVNTTKLPLPEKFLLSEFVLRRQQLINKIRATSTTGLILIANTPSPTNLGNSRFRPDSYFYYLTGFSEANAKILISITNKKAQTILFLQAKDPVKETWDGGLLGVEKAPRTLGVDIAFAHNNFAEEFSKILKEHINLYYAFGKNNHLDTEIINSLNTQRGLIRHGVLPIKTIYDSRPPIDEMRLIKSDFEIAQMRFAGMVSAKATTKAMSLCNVGINESVIMGALLNDYLSQGLTAPSFVPIVASGKNSCILHYQENNQNIPKDSLVLIDSGGEFNSYCADITRTVPSGSKFTPTQKVIYEIVLKAQRAGINCVKSGKKIGEYHQAVIRVITEGLREIKLLKGSVDKIIENGDYKKFYMHQAGHFIGLDTHDVGIYRVGENWQKFQVGMVVTVEPGIYIPAQSDVPKEFHNIGIRLEDDILVTKNGNENLTALAPIEIADVEAAKEG